ncbi:MAG: hypothetical protein U0572_06010 [Phycisphaerales bacterium]
MADPLTFHTVRLGELRDPALYARWDDVDAIAEMKPEKRRAFLANPCARGDDDPVQLLAVRGRHPLGRIDVAAGRLVVRGAATPIGWCSLLTVPEQHRHTLAGAFLAMRAATLFPNTGAHGPSRMAVPLYEKLKFADFAMPRLILMRRSRSVLEKKLGTGGLSRVASMLVDAGLACQRALLAAMRTASAGGVSVEPVSRVPEALDVQLARGEEPVKVWRSAAWLNWMLEHSFDDPPPEQPEFRREACLLRRRGEIVGYFVTKSRFYPVASASGYRDVLLGSLQDWQLFEPVMDERAIALLALDRLSRVGVDAMEVCLPPGPSVAALRRLGFVRLGDFHAMFKASPASPLSAPELMRGDAWRLRPGDGDNLFA